MPPMGMHVHMHAHMDGQVENIMSPAAHRIGGMVAFKTDED